MDGLSFNHSREKKEEKVLLLANSHPGLLHYTVYPRSQRGRKEDKKEFKNKRQKSKLRN